MTVLMTTGVVKAKGKGTILSHVLTQNAVHRLNVGGPSMLGIRYSRSCMDSASNNDSRKAET